MPLRLRDKVAVVTGGAGGIGRSLTRKFLNEGAVVFIADRIRGLDPSFINDLITEYENRMFFIETDASDSRQVADMVDEVVRRFDRIDILVNCAGIYMHSPLLEMSDEEWDQTIKVNLYSCFYCCRAAGKHMRARREGTIINISSIAGQRAATPGHAHYGTSKSGMIGFTRAAAAELGPFNVRVNSICPGLTTGTPMGDAGQEQFGPEYLKDVPLKRFVTPEDIAYGAVYLASEESRNITGAILTINGGIFMD